MRRRGWNAAWVAAIIGVLVMSVSSASAAAAPGSATGSATGTFCGARGTFATVLGVPEINWIVDNEGRATAAHNGGCFGISPGHHIYWTPRSHPSWRLMPGNGVAVRVDRTYIGHACPPAPSTCLAYAAPTVTVDTASGATYGQTWDPFSGAWGGHWYRV